MKYLVIFLCFLPLTVGAQCPEVLDISSQAEIDQFLIEYPNCRNLKQLEIKDIDNFDDLKQLEVVNSLRIINTSIKNISLDSLFEIGTFIIENNEFLENVSVLLLGGVTISGVNNPKLKQLTLGSNLFKVNYKVFNWQNFDTASQLDVINNIDTLSVEDLYILGDNNFKSRKIIVTRQFEVLNNSNYLSIEDFYQSFNIEKNLEILKLGYYDNFNLKGLERFNNIFQISFYSISQIENTSIDDLEIEISELAISDVNNQDLQFMNNAEAGTLIIYNNQYLSSLKGVRIDSSLQNKLYFVSNRELTNINIIEDLEALNIPSILGEPIINISDNPILEWCSYGVICHHLSNHPDQVIISDNKSYCEDKEILGAFCLSSSNTTYDDPTIKLSPNPSNGIVKVSSKVSSVDIINMQGVFLGRFESQSGEIDISILPNGVYITRLVGDDGDSMFIQKIIKI